MIVIARKGRYSETSWYIRWMLFMIVVLPVPELPIRRMLPGTLPVVCL